MELTKAETWKLARDLDILDLVTEMTHTDYHGDRSQRHAWGYGRLNNPASELRAKGFEEARKKGWI
jgi:7-cyano-7-deazaguanine synthase